MYFQNKRCDKNTKIIHTVDKKKKMQISVQQENMMTYMPCIFYSQIWNYSFQISNVWGGS